jgi:N-acetylneuraminate synthase/N,N'-diacetyllegionaminate synthase
VSARTFVIAEAGVNHNGSLATALRLVDAAADAGADAVKFQSFKAEKIVLESAPKAEYQKLSTGSGDGQFAMLKALELSESDHLEIARRCADRNILFLSTPFDEESADMLRGLGVGQFKIPSGEITNTPLLRHVARFGLPLLVSTGMADLEEVRLCVATLREAGASEITLLHCVTEYPAPVDQINLRAMATLREAFGVPVGYSDHSEGLEIAFAAVALGATVLEKHFTLDRTMPGPDHTSSLEPAELQAMVRGIHAIESALGNGVKTPAPCELKNRDVVRRSLVVARRIERGETVAEQDLTAKRPGTGICPTLIDSIVGRRIAKTLEPGSILEWKDLLP